MLRNAGAWLFFFFNLNLGWVVFAAVSSEGTLKEVAIIGGFRSVKFGMTESEVYEAIEKDFHISQKSVKKTDNPIDKTTSLSVTVPKLLQEGGQSRLFYILGYRSKKLIQVNVIWGNPFDSNPNPQGVLDIANVLRCYFFRKGFKSDDLLMNARLNDSSVVVFRGTDAKGRMIFLLLKSPSNTSQGTEDKNKELSLRLSYIENPNNPDIFKVKDGEF